MPNGVRIEIVENPAESLVEAVNLHLRTHNQASNPVFWEKRGQDENRPKLLTIFAFDGEGGVIGGLFATTQFSWLKIDIMATQKEHRGQGVGKALLARAEAAARDRGCKYAYTDTMEYQAPGFYQKAGYTIAGQLDDWDSHGHRKYFFSKKLV